MAKNHPFRLISILLKARRPSRVVDMPVIHDGLLLRKGYDALTFFGTIVAANHEMVEAMTDKMNALKNHEMIHLRQAQDTHDSWLCFYVLYLWHYLRLIPLNRKYKNAAYELNPFELEAYRHMCDLGYLSNEKCGKEWRVYARMKPKERLQAFALKTN